MNLPLFRSRERATRDCPERLSIPGESVEQALGQAGSHSASDRTLFASLPARGRLWACGPCLLVVGCVQSPLHREDEVEDPVSLDADGWVAEHDVF
jgi:hypothetical protein